MSSTTLTMTLRGNRPNKRWVIRCGVFAPVMLCPDKLQAYLDLKPENTVVRGTFYSTLPAGVSIDEAFTFTRGGEIQGVECDNAAFNGLLRYLHRRGYRYVVPWVEE